MIIAQISDTHIALDTPDADLRIENFAATIADINSLYPAPDVIVHTGDIVHNGQQDEYAVSAETLSKARAPVYVMPGNKDNRENLKQAFSGAGYIESESEFIQYAIDDFPVQLIMLDTVCSHSAKGEFCEARAGGLRKLVASNDAKSAAVFTHHPPFEANQCPDPFHFETRDCYDRLRNTLKETDCVAGVFCGHVHRFDWGEVGEIPATAMPSIATSLRWGDYSEAMKSRPVYQLHRFDPALGFVSETRIVGMG